METKTTVFRIYGTDVIMQDYDDGQGKLILSNDDMDYNISHYWGSMGHGYNLSKFIQEADNSYLIGKLGQRWSDGKIDIKKTMTEVRKFIKNESPWKFYYSPLSDKELRYELNQIQRYAHDDRDFVHRMERLEPYYDDSDDMYNRGEVYFYSMLEMIKNEPWHFIVRRQPNVNKWLGIFLPKLRSYLKNQEDKS